MHSLTSISSCHRGLRPGSIRIPPFPAPTSMDSSGVAFAWARRRWWRMLSRALRVSRTGAMSCRYSTAPPSRWWRVRLSTSRGRWQSQRVRLEYATLALGHSRRGHAVLAHELRVDESLVGCLLRPEDVGAGAPRPLERLPTPTYCDVTGASCETYDLNDQVPAYHVGWGRSYEPLNLRLKESGQS